MRLTPIAALPLLLVLSVSTDVSAGAVQYTGSLREPRANATTFLLDDGRVLVVGGNTTEVFDPSNASASDVIPSEVPISAHAATRLSDGRVFVAGGAYTGIRTIMTGSWGNDRAEIFDPFRDEMQPIGRMSHACMNAQATVLADGRVLITGGVTTEKYSAIVVNTVSEKAEIFDPVTNAFKPVGPMRVARFGHTATLLGDGRVLITGGETLAPYPAWPEAVATTEIFDPRTETFEPGPTMRTTRVRHTATRLVDGRVWIAGGLTWLYGTDKGSSPSTEIFDPSTNELEIGPDLGKRWDHTATLLPNGSLLLFGGTTDAIVYDPTMNRIIERMSLGKARRDHAATLLEDGSVLIIGGGDSAGGVYSAASADVLRYYPYARRGRAVRN
jgi:hypothetical protein